MWQIFSEKKNSAGYLVKRHWWKFAYSEAHKISRQITMFNFFISHFVCERQPAEFFFSKTITEMKAGQNEKHDITKISGFVQVWRIYSWFSYGLTTYNRPKCFPEPSWFNVNVLPTVKWGLLCIVWKSLTQDFCLSIFHWTHSCCCWSCFESSNRVIIHSLSTVLFRM